MQSYGIRKTRTIAIFRESFMPKSQYLVSDMGGLGCLFRPLGRKKKGITYDTLLAPIDRSYTQ